MSKKIKVFSLLMIFLICSVHAQESNTFNVYFFGVIAPYSQQNQVNITQDIFTAQIRTSKEFSLIDKRHSNLLEKYLEISDTQEVTDEALFNLLPQNISYTPRDVIIFAKIDKLENETYDCIFYTKNCKTNTIEKHKENFPSYYKILSDSKNSMISLLAKTCGIELQNTNFAKAAEPRKNNSANLSIEEISGTWKGEKEINKIILMRSGRGFVIFSNGASMNIQIEVKERNSENKVLKIIQNSNFNASFFPQIPRQKVLEIADTVNPIEWTFFLKEDGSLDGIKKSLGIDSDGVVFEERTKVIWTKVN